MAWKWTGGRVKHSPKFRDITAGSFCHLKILTMMEFILIFTSQTFYCNNCKLCYCSLLVLQMKRDAKKVGVGASFLQGYAGDREGVQPPLLGALPSRSAASGVQLEKNELSTGLIRNPFDFSIQN